MKTLPVWIACAIAVALPTHAFGQNPTACQTVQFSAELLERYPNAREACLDVITRDGQEYAVFKAQFDRAVGNTLHVRFRNPDGSRGPTTRVPTDPEFRILVDGQAKRVSEIARNQELTAYVMVDEPMVALAPAAPEMTLRVVPFVVVPASELAAASDESRVANASEEGPSMPATAGLAPALGAIGVGLIVVAIGAIAIRRLRAAHQERLLRLP